MTVAFTICSNNYLAHAKSLGDSFIKHHPEIKFVIGLVDTLSDKINYSDFSHFDIIPVHEIGIQHLEELNAKYTIKELNTAVKPSFFHYLFKKYSADSVIYLDPDILILNRFNEVLELLNEKNIILTPHMLTPVDDNLSPSDHIILSTGVFNLGFIALSNYEKVYALLNWWHDRVVKYGYEDLRNNMFYDQLWMNYVPTLFEDYTILKHPGYNMASWNLHERKLTVDTDGNFIVNENFNLCFFHFSSYHYNVESSICSYLTRYNFINRPDLKPLFDLYNSVLVKNRIAEISKLPVFYYPNLYTPKAKDKTFKKVTNRIIKSSKILLRGFD